MLLNAACPIENDAVAKPTLPPFTGSPVRCTFAVAGAPATFSPSEVSVTSSNDPCSHCTSAEPPPTVACTFPVTPFGRLWETVCSICASAFAAEDPVADDERDHAEDDDRDEGDEHADQHPAPRRRRVTSDLHRDGQGLRFRGGAVGHMRSGAVTPSRPRPFRSTWPTASLSTRRVRCTSSIGSPASGITRQLSYQRW